MSSSKPILLSIGIPVYNGGAYIAEAIESIQIPEELEGQIEILVSDNCSTDNTAEIVSRFSFVKYYRNNENIRYDRNVNEVFKKSLGTFVWLLAADDIILSKTALTQILSLIKLHDISLIHVGGSNIICNKDYEIYSDEKFFLASNFQSGGVSTNIIKRSSWFGSDPEAFFDTEWIHFGIIIKLVRLFDSLITREQLCGENPSTAKIHKTWDSNGRSLIVMLKLIKLFKIMKGLEYPKSFRRRAKYLIKGSYPKEIIKSKAKGLKVNWALIWDFIDCYKEFPSFWLIDLPVLLSPAWICKYLYRHRTIVKRNHAD